jgi:hypothetical protein
VHRVALVVRELEGQRLEPFTDQGTGGAEPLSVCLSVAWATAAQEPELKEEQLLQDQPPARQRRLLRRARKVSRGERVRPTGQSLGAAKPCR